MVRGVLREQKSVMDPADLAQVYFYIDTKDTNFINRILEGYEYLGVMTTVDRATGLSTVRCTPDTRALTIQVLESLAPQLIRLEIL